MTEPFMKCCRYCRSFDLKEGLCKHPKLQPEVDNNLEQVIDDGIIVAAIKEEADELIFGNEIQDKIEAAIIAVLRNSLEFSITPGNGINPSEYYCNLWE